MVLKTLELNGKVICIGYIGDTLGYIVSRGLILNLQYVNYDTTYLTQFNGLEVPTSNQVSLSNSKGEINNMIAPVREYDW